MVSARTMSLAVLVFGCSALVDVGWCRTDPMQRRVEEAIRLYENGKSEDALSLFASLVKIRKNNATVHYYLARIYAVDPMKDMEKARFHYDQAKKLKLNFQGNIAPIDVLAPVVDDTPSSRGLPDPLHTVKVIEPSLQDSTSDETVSVLVVADTLPSSRVPDPVHSTEVEEPGAQEIGKDQPVSLPMDEVGIDHDNDALRIEALADTDFGQILRKEKSQGKLALTPLERRTFEWFDKGLEECLRRIERGDYKRATQYAGHVIHAAPDFWHGYYLQARIHLEQEDMVNAKRSWEAVEARHYNPSPMYPSLAAEIIADELSLFNHYVERAERHLRNKEWIEADAVFLKAEDVEGYAYTEEVTKKLDAVDYMMGQIALELEDYNHAVERLEDLLETEEPPSGTQQLLDRARAKKDSVDNISVERIHIDIAPPEWRSLAGAYGIIKIDTGKDYVASSMSHAERSRIRTISQTVAAGQGVYPVEGGRVYKVEFDKRNQLRNAAVHGLSVLFLFSLLLGL